MLPNQLKELEIIKKLSTDATGVEFKSMVERLELGRVGVRRQIDAGVTPDEYRSLSKLVSGYDAALELLPEIWRRAQSL